MTQTILISGVAGYLGSVLCDTLLSSGYRVIGLDNLHLGDHSLFHLCHFDTFEFIKGDVRDERLMRELLGRVDAVIPLAAIVGAPACDRNPWLAEQTNLESIRLLQRLRSTSQLVVYPTTNSGYGTTSALTPCTEDSPLNPISLYGRTKMEAESALLSSGTSISLRLATVFGASARMRYDLLVNNFVYEAMRVGSLLIFEKDFKRNFVHIRDVADCFVFCLENSQRLIGKAFNFGLDAANISKEQLALKIQEQIPRLEIRFADNGKDPDQRNYVVSNDRLRKAGFEARRSLEGGIAEVIKTVRTLPRSRNFNV